MRIIFATHNQNKLAEICRILGQLATEVVSQRDLGIMVEPEENGTTFAENAEIKAAAIHAYMKEQGMLQAGDVVIADDSGLCVDYLNGEPGIYSSRFMGEDTSYAVKNAYIIDALRGVEGDARAAHFACNMCAVLSDGRVLHTEGIFPGLIATQAAGCGGFGYDPILYLPEYGKTSAEISMDEKNAISHRGKALRAMRELLEEMEKV